MNYEETTFKDITRMTVSSLGGEIAFKHIISKLGGYPQLRPGFPCGNIIIINVLVNKSDIVARVKLVAGVKVLQEWNC